MESDGDSEDDFEFLERKYVENVYHFVGNLFQEEDYEEEGSKHDVCLSLPCIWVNYANCTEVPLTISPDSGSPVNIVSEFYARRSGIKFSWAEPTDNNIRNPSGKPLCTVGHFYD